MASSKPTRGAVICLLATAFLVACSPSKEEVADSVKSMFQNRLASEKGVADLHATVSSVTLIKDQGNRYEGIATVMLDGKAHEVPVKVLADGKSVMYEAEPTALGFLLEAQMGKLFPKSRYETESPSEVQVQSMPNEVVGLTAQWESSNNVCRGGSGDSPTTASSCDARDTFYREIRARGWCWGHRDDISSDRRWTRCYAGDP